MNLFLLSSLRYLAWVHLLFWEDQSHGFPMKNVGDDLGREDLRREAKNPPFALLLTFLLAFWP